MSTPKGNQFWKLGPQPGAPKKYETVEEIAEIAQEYIDNCVSKDGDAAFWQKTEVHGKNAEKISLQLYKPMSIEGLSVYMGITSETWREYKKRKEFSVICSRVEDIIFTYQFEGATVGAFSHALVARKLGIKEQQEISMKAAYKVDFNEE